MAKLVMKVIHWNETDGIWYDYDLEKKVSVENRDNMSHKFFWHEKLFPFPIIFYNGKSTFWMSCTF